MTAGIIGQGREERTRRPHDSKDRIAGTRQLRRNNSDGTSVTEFSEHDTWEKTTETGQPRLFGLDNSAWQVTLDMTERTGRPGHDSKDRTV